MKKPLQIAEIERTIARFRSLLKTVACDPSQTSTRPRDLVNLVDTVGDAFYESAILDEFSAEPYGSFTVDSNTPPSIMMAIGTALNAGAVVYVPDNPSELLLQNLRGKRFRLTYLLSPYYHTPIRLGAPISLSKLLREAAGTSSDQTSFNL